MTKIKYSIRNCKFDLITVFSAFVSYYLAFKLAANSNALLVWSIITTIILFLIIVFLRTRDRNFYFIGLDSREDRDDWIGRGKFEYSRISKSFIITDSEPGYIYSKCLNWSDYKFEFEFKIINTCLGVVIRAVDLSNYVMFQMREDGIRPHVRVNGGWRPWEHKEAGLTFSKKLSLDKWYKCVLVCDKDLVDIRISANNEGVVFHRTWTIPHERLGFPFPQIENDPKPTVIHFPIDLDYGTAGFRDSHNEKAFIKNVLIEKLSYGKN